ncbi:MAG: hypothetical protein HS115_08800 [Spirochaetales bacterium]|nr:hypothetical protein [Spirochaetales bacterium]
MKAVILVLLTLSLMSPSLKADGCYICQGSPNTYVKFSGNDSFEKRKEAEKCGCKVGGTTGSCNAANYKVLCSVLGPAVPLEFAWIVR